jgi:hypothetical protein
MAWTAPRTWASGELVTADLMNSAVKNNLLVVQGAVLSKSAGYTIVAADFAGGVVTVKVDTTGGSDVTIVLPASSGIAGYRVNVILSDATFTNGASTGTCIIDGSGSELINGLANTTLFLEFDHVTMTCDGTGWLVVDEHTTVAASYYNDADIEFADNVWEQILYNDATLMDSASACSSGNFTVPVGFAGIYQLLTTMRWEGVADPGDTFHLIYYLNGVLDYSNWAASYVTWMDDGGRPSGYAITQAPLDAGDVISVWGKANITDTEVDVDAGPGLGCFHANLLKRTWA